LGVLYTTKCKQNNCHYSEVYGIPLKQKDWNVWIDYFYSSPALAKRADVHKTRLSWYFKTEHKNLMLIYLKGI